ncbi:MAG: TonB family protein [Flavobacteriales bacterium]
MALLLMLMLRDCGGGAGDGTQFMSLNVASLGDFDQGSGDSQDAATVAQTTNASEPQTEESVETQEEAPVVAPKPVDNPNPKPDPKPNPKPDPKPQEVSNPLNNALNSLNNNNGSQSGGGDTQGGGKEGNPDGRVDGKGIFNGGGGNGSWALTGRSMTAQPKLDERPTEEGKVVVDIIVDKNGNVVSANVNSQLSNTTASGATQLYALALKAAKSAKFSVKPDATTNQKGSITIYFELK